MLITKGKKQPLKTNQNNRQRHECVTTVRPWRRTAFFFALLTVAAARNDNGYAALAQQGTLSGPSKATTPQTTQPNTPVTGAVKSAVNIPTYKMAEVLKRPDTDVLTGIDGKPITVGEVRRRVNAALAPLANKYAQQKLAAPVRVQLPKSTSAINTQQGASIGTVDPRMIAELQALPDDELLRRLNATPSVTPPVILPPNPPTPAKGGLASQAPNLTSKDQPCGLFVGRLPEQQHRFFISSVNNTGYFAVDLEKNNPSYLILSGCFDPINRGRVVVSMPNTLATVNADIQLWEEKLIIARLTTANTYGFDDGEISVTVHNGNPGFAVPTNSRKGYFHAKRQTVRVNPLKVQESLAQRSGSLCPPQQFSYNSQWLERGLWQDVTGSSYSVDFGLRLKGEPCQTGQDMFTIPTLRPSFQMEVSSMLIQGKSLRITPLTYNSFAADWAKDIHRFGNLFGIPVVQSDEQLLSYLYYRFNIDLSGPAGVSPYLQ